MKLSFKNRIATQYMVASAIVIALVFTILFFIVKGIVYENIDLNLSYEANKHTKEIEITNDSIRFLNKEEWQEREHREAQVNPVFIQIMSSSGGLMDKSPNLKEQSLIFSREGKFGTHFNSSLSNKSVRQIQLPIEVNGKIKGYILAAVSLEASESVLNRLRSVLIISYPIILFGLFFISQYLAGRSIQPVKKITETTKHITQKSLSERVEIPPTHDELFELSSSINDLLNRLQNAFERERQFTSDASHELRTPISSIQGTLEVLIRKPRTPEEYNEKINFCLTELSKMSGMIEQLFLLARLDDQYSSKLSDFDSLQIILEDIHSRYSDLIHSKLLKVEIINGNPDEIKLPKFHATLLFENIISNAIKYSREGGRVMISIEKQGEQDVCRVIDEGIGIQEEEIPKIFRPFFRSSSMQGNGISGYGLGMSIALKAANAIKASLQVESKPGKGTIVSVFLRKS